MVYFGIYRNKNPGDEKMAEQKKKMLFALKQCCLLYRRLEKKDETLTIGLKTHLRGDLNS